MRAAQGEAYVQPHRPLGMGGTLTKLAAIYALGNVEAVVCGGGWASPIYIERQRRV